MISIHHISLLFDTQKIFEDLSINIDSNARYGVVGRNGSGKSTLLKVIAGKQNVDSGTIAIAKDVTIAYLPQEVVIASEKSILDEALSTNQIVYSLLAQAKKLEAKLEASSTHDHDQTTVNRYSSVQHDLLEHNGHQYVAETKQILQGLGFGPSRWSTPVSQLSGGWKMRLVLAKLLLQKADFYLFDEPTNHLDIMAQEWFLSFLKQSRFGFLLVCHERYFLDELCTHMLALDRGNNKLYTGSYSNYEKLHAAEKEALQKAYIEQHKDIKRKMATIDRFRYKASKAKMAQSMLKQVEKIERIEIESDPKNMKISFPAVPNSGKAVLTIENVAHSFGEHNVFSNISFTVEKGQKVAIIGPNGQGKTTLFNVISGKLPCQSGDITLGHNVTATICEQDQDRILDQKKTVLEEVLSVASAGQAARARSMLGAFLFSGESCDKKIAVLSGGERNRVAMVKTLLQNANLLLLDEPTNHLDIQSKEILARALQEYPGTILFVSHDKDFLNKLATHIVELTPTKANWYIGNYDDYRYQTALTNNDDLSVNNQVVSEKKSTKSSAHKNRKEINKIKRKIEQLEQKIADLETSLSTLSYGTESFDQAHTKLADAQKELELLYETWHNLSK